VAGLKIESGGRRKEMVDEPTHNVEEAKAICPKEVGQMGKSLRNLEGAWEKSGRDYA